MVDIMASILLSGFFTGLLLQIAIGPVFFFILNIAVQKTLIDGLFAVLAVTLVDYFFIVLAVLGIGKLLEKPKIKSGLGITSSIVLMLFGILMIFKIQTSHIDHIPNGYFESNYIASFVATFLLTISSPLTIVFWTGLFASKAIEKGYTTKQLSIFGIAAGSATFVFLGSSVALFSGIRASIPIVYLALSNIAVGTLLIVYGAIRLCRIVMRPERKCSAR
jgi:threonine/homoserine/homoserine lactone efflux protein